nr:MAG TPA: hypothetical protein [Bacteriophage sp.]
MDSIPNSLFVILLFIKFYSFLPLRHCLCGSFMVLL